MFKCFLSIILGSINPKIAIRLQFFYYESDSFLNNSFVSGIQGDDIGDVKFNSDGDGLGRYSVYQ